jgi:drug/metabolite transporter superfamily protein YnfA
LRQWRRSAGLADWQGVREHRGLIWVAAGIAALAAYGFVATLQDDNNFGRILAAYGGIFVAGSLAWGMIADGSVRTASTWSVPPFVSSGSL